MANWTDGTPQIFTEEDLKAKWGLHGGKNYCTLCNKDFKVGDVWRWIFGSVCSGNFQVCSSCDGPDVRNRHEAAHWLMFESMKGRGKHHWPVDIAAKLIASKESLEQVDDVLVVNWIDVKGNDYKAALNSLIGFNIRIATDPAVNGGKILVDEQEYNEQASELERLRQELSDLKADRSIIP